jgi:putative membrane protein
MRTLATVLSLGLTALTFAATSGDETFYQKVGEAGLAEVQAGKMAEANGASQEVREFGALMVEHHGEANRKLAKLAQAKGMTLPAAPSESQMKAMQALQAKEGTRFDQAYLAEQVKAHEEAVQLLKGQIASGEDAEAKAFASELLPKVESHLRTAYQLSGQEEKVVPPPE